MTVTSRPLDEKSRFSVFASRRINEKRRFSQSPSLKGSTWAVGQRNQIMPKVIDGVLSEAEQLVRVWTANPTFSLGETTLQTVRDMIADLRLKKTELEETRTILTRQVDAASDKVREINQMLSRARFGIRGTFGTDSSQYSQVGGTRLSERRPRLSRRSSAPRSAAQ
jgi:hypothetical protein